MEKQNKNLQSGRRQGSSSGRTGVKNNNVNKAAARDLLSREEEYKRLNEELEARTASLVQEADAIMLEQDSLLSSQSSVRPSLLDNINTEDFLEDLDDDHDEDVSREDKPPTSSRPVSSRPQSQVSNQIRPQSRKKKTTNRPPQRKKKSSAAEHVAVPDDTFLTELHSEMTLQKTISNIEGKFDQGELHYDEEEEEDVMPSAAAEMGAEAQIRFLKAKLRVMQEELDRLSHECNKKEEENNDLISRIKDLEDERGRLHRTNASQQTQIDKYKKLAEDAKGKADSLDTQLTGTRKELETLKRNQKQQASTQSATEVRLNRALEEIEKYKSQLQKSKTNSKESTDQEKRRMEQLMAENKRLEKQKNELLTGFKKQLKLIDILKRQKMHIEAAKMLAFTEEEFVKALEWGN